MTNSDYFAAVRAELNRSLLTAHDAERAEQLRALVGETETRMLAVRERQTVRFGLESGYVSINDVVRPQPPRIGIQHAWHIWLAGATVRHSLHAADLVGLVERPDNALRNALSRAAEWFETEAQCRPLAAALRPPVLTIGKDGTITYDQARGPRILLE